MHDKIINNSLITICLLMLIGALVFVGWSTQQQALGAAEPGNPGTIATSTNINVPAGAVTVIASSTCTARIITTSPTSPIMLTFSDVLGQTPTATYGHVQAASTTVVYDSGLYGCGRVKAFGWGTSVITITDVR